MKYEAPAVTPAQEMDVARQQERYAAVQTKRTEDASAEKTAEKTASHLDQCVP